MLKGETFDWREAWSAIIAVGLRPCSGALIVLSFALLNGLYIGGVLSVLAMSVGTAITVSALATIAVTDYYAVEPIAARDAWYVVGSDVLGPMGHELVPLATEAEELAAELEK